FRERVGMVFHISYVLLFCPTVFDELVFWPQQLGLPKEEVLRRASETMEMLNIEYLKDRPTHMLSGGEKKRVAIGSSLAMNPEVLLLDEPASGLDPKTESFLTDLIISLSESGKTIVIATHDLELVDHLQPKVAVISEEHRIEKVGTVNEVLKDQDLLVKVNLVHEHRHRHGNKVHSHLHSHYFFHDHQKTHSHDGHVHSHDGHTHDKPHRHEGGRKHQDEHEKK
ncbi:MAG TPA: ATP-binding cassette domain-containing protein, partial [Spirochaetota bacterium]|nr:ATP-binding cassette domain-containing protein [Spirochaetota bacterium]